MLVEGAKVKVNLPEHVERLASRRMSKLSRALANCGPIAYLFACCAIHFSITSAICSLFFWIAMM